MNAVVGTSLGLVFVGLATLSVVTILESSRPTITSRTRARAISIHRACGYLYVGLFAVMIWAMSKRLIGTRMELSAETVVHIALALLLAPLVLAKVMIVRRYKKHQTFLLPLGLSIFAISFTLVFLRVLPYVFGRLDRPSPLVRYSIAPLVAFCAYIAISAVRAIAPSIDPPPSSLSIRPSSVVDSRRNTLSLELTGVEAQTHDAKTLRFRLLEGRHLQAKPGQFLTFHLNIDGNEVIRSYSICSSPLSDHVEITPKRAENGYASVFLNERATKGLVVQARGPFGKFYFDEQIHTAVVMIAGGSGITPMMAMLRYIEDRELSVPVTLIYCVRTPQDIIFERELDRLARSIPNFRYVVTVSTPGADWNGSTGRLSKSFLLKYVPDFRTPTFFLCGPKPFMQLASDLIEEQGVVPDRIRQESFGGNSSVTTRGPAGDRPVGTLELIRSGLRCDLHPDMTLLELAEAASVSIPYSCRQGQCGTCATRLLRGHVTMQAEDGLSIEQKQAGFILPCVSKANDSVAIDA